jgi:NTE family protein
LRWHPRLAGNKQGVDGRDKPGHDELSSDRNVLQPNAERAQVATHSKEVDMSHPARSALVLQGGGALGAYELGAARALYEDGDFAPDVIAGVSIGAITAVLLARPARGLTPLAALEAFWKKITVTGFLLPPPLRPYASVLGNPNFFVPRLDYFTLPSWTNIYDTTPLRHTLEQLVDLEALADKTAEPGLLVSATDIAAGQIEYFYSHEQQLSLDHIVASGSLPPSFPMTVIDGTAYWDGGLFDNTPLGAVLDRLDTSAGADRAIYVVNLFPNEAPIPTTLLEVNERVQNLQFANRTLADVKMLHRIDEVADLMAAIDSLPAGNLLKGNPAYEAVKKRAYVRVPEIISITRQQQVAGFDGTDFSPATIEKRADEGYAQTKQALKGVVTEFPKARRKA